MGSFNNTVYNPEYQLSVAVMKNWLDKDRVKCIYCKGIKRHNEGCITYIASEILKKYNEGEKFNG